MKQQIGQNKDNLFSKKEMELMLEKMRMASNTFYSMAIQTGCHAFIEFTGMMNKYIDICYRALNEGKQFPFANKHCGEKIHFEDHDIKYLAEKFECIFGVAFQDDKLWDAFVQIVRG